MKVEYIVRSEKEVNNCDYRSAYHIKINDELVFKVQDGEPEDSNLGRDFSDVWDIGKMLKMAFEAGKRGEEFVSIESESDEI